MNSIEWLRYVHRKYLTFKLSFVAEDSSPIRTGGRHSMPTSNFSFSHRQSKHVIYMKEPGEKLSTLVRSTGLSWQCKSRKTLLQGRPPENSKIPITKLSARDVRCGCNHNWQKRGDKDNRNSSFISSSFSYYYRWWSGFRSSKRKWRKKRKNDSVRQVLRGDFDLQDRGSIIYYIIIL